MSDERIIQAGEISPAPERQDASAEHSQGIGRGLVITMAVASGLAAANLYYNQPLLAEIARSLRIAERQVGLLPALSQVGYAIGLFSLVPLGDILERRKLVVTLFGIVASLLALACCAPNLTVLAVATLAIGVTTVMAQILLPFAAHLAPPAQRGKIVGGIMSGLLLGILLSRTVSGFVGEMWGWRAMYAIAASLMLLLAILLRFLLPSDRSTTRMSYAELLRSLFHLIRTQPVLRESAISGGFVFGCFSAFWATLVFFLDSPAYRLGPHVAGLFGLVGAVGAMASSLTGRLADKRSPRLLVALASLLIVLSYLLFWALGTHLWALIVGVILLDFGVQAAHVANQTRVYSLMSGANSRLNTVYMTTYFIGGASGSFLGAWGWNIAGWNGVCTVGLLLATLAVLAPLLLHRIQKPASALPSETI